MEESGDNFFADNIIFAATKTKTIIRLNSSKLCFGFKILFSDTSLALLRGSSLKQ